MIAMVEKINSLKAEIMQLSAANVAEVEALRIKYLSKKGLVSQLFNDFRGLSPEDKRALGAPLNELKDLATNKINELKESLESVSSEADAIDMTRTASPIKLGTRHPLSVVRNEIVGIFSRLGFTIAEGPEIEDDWHVFSSLNFAADHPARDMQDTFFIQRTPDVLLRTHTSSVQSRVMENTQPPIRIICPGRVYRNEAISARAHCFFHQVEALYVDKNVSFADLKQTLLYLPRKCSVPRLKSVFVRATSRLRSRRPKWTSPAIFAEARDARSASTPDGWKSSDAAWLTQMCLTLAG